MFTNTLLNFTLQNQIGEGGEGTVFTANDPQLNAQIVIKKIPKAKFRNINKYFEESKKLYLTTHHNIVKIMYGCQDDENIYLAMPHYLKGSMKNLIDSRFLTSREIIRYSLQFLSGLNNIHSKSLLHFDVKPENILIDDSNKALISDFGLAEYTGHYGFAEISGTTQAYAPPEFFEQALHNIKFDIYQAGLTLYRMCNGENIFQSQLKNAFISKSTFNDSNFINNIKKGNFPNRNSYLPHIPKALKKVINTALNPDPNIRYDSIIELLNDLSKIECVNDWNYSVIDDIHYWKKTNYEVKCSFINNNSSVISALKSNRRNTKFCVTLNSQTETNNLLYDCLNNDW